MKSIIIFIFLMEKLDAVFSEIEMHDKGLTGIELKMRALFLGRHTRVIGASTEPEHVLVRPLAKVLGFQVCTFI